MLIFQLKLGSTLHGLNRFEEALECANEWLQYAPGNLEAFETKSIFFNLRLQLIFYKNQEERMKQINLKINKTI